MSVRDDIYATHDSLELRKSRLSALVVVICFIIVVGAFFVNGILQRQHEARLLKMGYKQQIGGWQ